MRQTKNELPRIILFTLYKKPLVYIFFNFEVFPGISHWGKKNVKNSILLKTCQLRYLNFRAKNQIENPRISVLWLRKFMKYLNFRAKNQIENPWILVLWFQKFKYFYLNFFFVPV